MASDQKRFLDVFMEMTEALDKNLTVEEVSEKAASSSGIGAIFTSEGDVSEPLGRKKYQDTYHDESDVPVHKKPRYEGDQQGGSKLTGDSAKGGFKLLPMEYVEGTNFFKCIPKHSFFLRPMGILRAEGHYLFPEEAVWLTETKVGCVLRDGIPLSIQQGYRMLEELGVSHDHYLVYCQLKKAGYMVRIASRREQIAVLNSKASVDAHRRNDSSTSASGSAPLTPERASFSGASLESEIITPVQSINDSIFEVPKTFPAYSYGSFYRTARAYEDAMRPSHWPRFDSFIDEVTNWTEYREAKRKALKSGNLYNEISRSPPIDRSTLEFDYDVYSRLCMSFSDESELKYRVYVYVWDDTCKVHLMWETISRLPQPPPGITPLYASVTCSNVMFHSFSGGIFFV